MTSFTTRSRGKARGFTLVELLVVIAIIGILAMLLTPVLLTARQEGFKTDCKNNLRSVAAASQMYADQPQNRFYPWPRPIASGSNQPELSEDADARAALELLYKYGFIDDARVFICRSSTDDAAEEYDTEQERRTSFRLEEHQCSFTWRKKLTTVNDDSKTPISGDKRGGEEGLTNHTDGRHVVFKGTNVEWFANEQLEEQANKKTKRSKAELIGFDRIGRS